MTRTSDAVTGMLDQYFQLMNFNGAAHVYRQAVDLGILESLTSGPAAASDVAQRCGTVARITEMVLDVCHTLGLVSKSNGQFSLTMLARGLLGGTYRHLGDEYWSHLSDLLTTGEPRIELSESARSEAFYAQQAMGLAWMTQPASAAAAEWLVADSVRQGAAPRNWSILDVGAGSAVWSLSLAAAVPDSRVTAVDRPAVLKVAMQLADDFGLTQQLQLLAGDYHQMALPTGEFDIAILANVAHLETPDDNLRLFQRLRATLRPRGQLVVIDVIPELDKGQLSGALYALGLALRTRTGRVYTAQELDELLCQAGFGSVQFTQLDVPPYALGLLVASTGND